MESSEELIDDICTHHQALGMLCYEAHMAYRSELYAAALSCLFIIAESTLKYGLEASDDNEGFYKAIGRAADTELISSDEANTLHLIRRLRNDLFHNDHYASFPILIDGLLSPLHEAETKKLIYERYSNYIYKLAYRLVNQ